MPIRWSGTLGGKENHRKMLELFIKNYNRFNFIDGYGSIEYDPLRHVPRIIQVDVQIRTKDNKLIWIEVETNFDNIFFKACRIGFSLLYLLNNKTPDYNQNMRNIPNKIIFLALYNPVTRFMMRTGFKNRNLLIEYLQNVINLSNLSINIELYAIDIENNRIMNCQEYIKDFDE